MNWNIDREQNSDRNLRFLSARKSLFSPCNFWVGASFVISVFFVFCAILTPADAKDLASFWAILTLMYSLFEVGYIDRLILKRSSQCAGLAEEFDCSVFGIERNSNFVKEDSDHTINTLSSKLDANKKNSLKNWYSSKLGEVPKPVAALIAQYTSTAYDHGLRELYIKILSFALTLLFISILAYILYEDQKFRGSIVAFAVPFLPILVWLIKTIVANRSLVDNQNAALKLMEGQWEQVKRKRLAGDRLHQEVRDNQDALYCRRSNSTLVFPKLYALYRPKLESRAAQTANRMVDEYLAGA